MKSFMNIQYLGFEQDPKCRRYTFRVIDTLKETGVRDQVKVMIGGAPITQRYADEIGADGFSDNASGAVRLARSLVG